MEERRVTSVGEVVPQPHVVAPTPTANPRCPSKSGGQRKGRRGGGEMEEEAPTLLASPTCRVRLTGTARHPHLGRLAAGEMVRNRIEAKSPMTTSIRSMAAGEACLDLRHRGHSMDVVAETYLGVLRR